MAISLLEKGGSAFPGLSLNCFVFLCTRWLPCSAFCLFLIAEVAFNANHRSDLLPQTLRCSLELIGPHTKSGCNANALRAEMEVENQF